jgi:hypothetical protein
MSNSSDNISWSVKNGDIEQVRNLIVSYYCWYCGLYHCCVCQTSANVNDEIAGSPGRTVLHVAADYGHKEIVEHIIQVCDSKFIFK